METSVDHGTDERVGTETGSAATGQGGYGERQGGRKKGWGHRRRPGTGIGCGCRLHGWQTRKCRTT